MCISIYLYIYIFWSMVEATLVAQYIYVHIYPLLKLYRYDFCIYEYIMKDYNFREHMLGIDYARLASSCGG